LHLLTANTGSDQSMVDDGISSDAEEKRAKNEVIKNDQNYLMIIQDKKFFFSGFMISKDFPLIN
jgi:hypothetical protein